MSKKQKGGAIALSGSDQKYFEEVSKNLSSNVSKFDNEALIEKALNNTNVRGRKLPVPEKSSTGSPVSEDSEDLNFASGTVYEFMNNLDRSVQLQLQGLVGDQFNKATAVGKLLTPAMKDPKFTELLDFLYETRNVEVDVNGKTNEREYVTPLHNHLLDLHKNEWGGVDEFGFKPVIYGDERTSSSYVDPDIASAGVLASLMFGIKTPIAEYKTRSGLPGLNKIPDELKPTYMRYSGLLSSYLSVKDNFKVSQATKGWSIVKGLLDATADVTELFGAEKDKNEGFDEARLYDKINSLGKQMNLKEFKGLADESRKVQRGERSSINTSAMTTEITHQVFGLYKDVKKEIDERQDLIDIRSGNISEVYKRKLKDPESSESIISGVGLSMASYIPSTVTLLAGVGVSALTRSKLGMPMIAEGISIASNVLSNVAQREGETNMELAEYTLEKFKKDYKGISNIDIDKLDDIELLNLIDKSSGAGYSVKKSALDEISKNGQLSEHQIESLKRGLASGMIPTSDENLSKAVKSSTNGIDEYKRQQMSNSVPDMMFDAVAISPSGIFRKGAINMLSRGVSMEMKSMLGKTIRATSGVLKKVAEGSMKNIPAKMATSYIGKGLWQAPFEGVEEAQQYITGKRYVNGTLADGNSTIESYIDGFAANLTGVSYLLGMNSGAELYVDRSELKTNAKIGAISGFGQTVVTSTLHGIPGVKGQYAQKRADEFVDGLVNSRFDVDGSMNKSKMYTTGVSGHDGDRLYSALKNRYESEPDAEKKAILKEELDFAGTARAIYNSNSINAITDGLGWSKSGANSIKADATALAMAHKLEYDKAMSEVGRRKKTIDAYKVDDYGPAITSMINRISEAHESKNGAPLADSEKLRLARAMADAAASRFISNKSEADIKAYNGKTEKSQDGATRMIDPKSDKDQFNGDRELSNVYMKSSSIEANLRVRNMMEYMSDLFPELELSSIESELNEMHTGIPSEVFDNFLVSNSARYGAIYDKTVYDNILDKSRHTNKDSYQDYVFDKVSRYRESGEAEDNTMNSPMPGSDSKTNTLAPIETTEVTAKENLPATEVVTTPVVQAQQPAATAQAQKSESPAVTVSEDPIGEYDEIVPEPQSDDNAPSLVLGDEDVIVTAIENEEEDTQSEIALDWAFGMKTDTKEESDDRLEIELAIETASKEVEPEVVEDVIGTSISVESVTEAKESEVHLQEARSVVLASVTPGNKFVHFGKVLTYFKNHPAYESVIEWVKTLSSKNSKYKSEVVVYYMGETVNELTLDQLDAIEADRDYAQKHPGDNRFNNKWDSLMVGVRVTKGDESFIVNMRNPAKMVSPENSVRPTDAEIDLLKSNRDNLIQLFIDAMRIDSNMGTKTKIIPNIKASHNITKKQGSRKLGDVDGFEFPRDANGNIDFEKINVETMDFSYRSNRDGFSILQTIRGSVMSRGPVSGSNSQGGIHVFVTNPYSGDRVPIKLNPLEFGQSDKESAAAGTQSIVDIVCGMLFSEKFADNITIDKTTGRIIPSGDTKALVGGVAISIPISSFLETMINFNTSYVHDSGKSSTEDEFLVSKHIKVSGHVLSLAGKQYTLNALSAKDKAEIRAHIAKNITFKVDKLSLVDGTQDGAPDKTVSDVFPGLNQYQFDALMNNGNDVAIDFGAFTIERSDLNLTWFAFLIKKGLIRTDTFPTIFAPAYLNLESVHEYIEKPDGTPAQAAVIAAKPGGELVDLQSNEQKNSELPDLDTVKERIRIAKAKAEIESRRQDTLKYSPKVKQIKGVLDNELDETAGTKTSAVINLGASGEAIIENADGTSSTSQYKFKATEEEASEAGRINNMKPSRERKRLQFDLGKRIARRLLDEINAEYDAEIAALEAQGNTQAKSDTNTPDSTDKSVKTPENKPGSDFKVVDQSMDFDEDFGPLREQENSDYELINMAQELEWLRDKLNIQPGDVEVVKDLIKVGRDKLAMGVMRDSGIVLSMAAEIGTSFHEAYHKVSLLLLPRETRVKIYEEARNRWPQLKGLSNEQVEEFLAEKFREYVMKNGTVKNFTRLQIAFRKIYNFIRKIVGFSNSDIDRLFNDINRGMFRYDSINSESLREFKAIYGSSVNRHVASDLKMMNLDEFYESINGMTYMLFQLGGVVNKSNKINETKAYNDLYANIEILANKALADGDNSRHEVLSEILEHFEDKFKPQIKKYIDFIGYEDNISDDIDPNAIENDQEITRADLSEYTESNKFNHKDRVLPEVKAFIATMPLAKVVDGRMKSIKSELTGFNSFIPFDTAWNVMISRLGSANDIDSMMNRIANLAKTDPFFRILGRRLANQSVEFNTKFFTSVNTQRHEYITASYRDTEDGMRWDIRDISEKEAEKLHPKIWGNNLSANDNVYDYNENGDRLFDPKHIQSAIDAYENLIVESKSMTYTAIASKFVEILGMVGIDVDQATFDGMFLIGNNDLNIRKNFVDYISSGYSVNKSNPSILFRNILPKLIKNNGRYMKSFIIGKEVEKNVSAIYAGEPFAEKLAREYARTHPSPEEVMVSAADGGKMYAISLPNYMTTIVNRLREDSTYRSLIKSVKFNRGRGDGNRPVGSMILSQMQEAIDKGRKVEVKLKTFVKLYQEGTADKGRDYFGMSVLEDYIFKMQATLRDFMVLPTMADKKTYYLLSGLKWFNGAVNKLFVDTTNRKVTFSSYVVSQFSEYAAAEFEAMKEAWNLYKSLSLAKSEAEYMDTQSSMMPTYHYFEGKDGSIKPGNGLFFRHFNFEVNSSDGKGMTTLNDMLSEAYKTGDVSKVDEMMDRLSRNYFNNSDEAKSLLPAKISATLQDRLLDEIEYAESIGAISYPVKTGDRFRDAMQIANLALDEKEISEHLKYYNIDKNNGSNPIALINMMAANMVNTMASTIEYEKIFAKDPAFHKNDEAKIKRHSTMLSTGNNLRTIFPVGHRLHNKEKYSVTELNDSNIVSQHLKELTIKAIASNANRRLTDAGESPDSGLLEALMSNSGILPEDYNKSVKEAVNSVREASIDQMSGYGNVDETDATAYCSPMHYRETKERLGEWEPWMDEALAILESEDMGWMSDPVKAELANKLQLQPLKMIYVGNSVENGLDILVINKMAIFPVFKHHSTAGLSDMYSMMNPTETEKMYGVKPIDMFIFKTAIKDGNRRGATYAKKDKDGNITGYAKRDELKVTTQEFKFLRKQLVTDPHEPGEMRMATQINKMAMSNIDKSRIYSKAKFSNGNEMTGDQLISAYDSANKELAKRGFDRLLKRLGDKASVYKYLYDSAIESGMPEDLVSKLKEAADGRPFRLEYVIDNAWVESKLMSLIGSEIIDINTPGGMFIQRTPFGLSSVNTDALNSNKISEDEFNEKTGGLRMLNNGKRLNFFRDNNAIEAIVSINLFMDIIPSNIIAHEDRVKWLMDRNIIGPNSAPSAIGYRVPNQGPSSSAVLLIVDVLPTTDGDTIILPSEFTKMTGSDFDIDKLFLARYSYEDYNTGNRIPITTEERDELRTAYKKWADTPIGSNKGVVITNESKFAKKSAALSEFLSTEYKKGIRYDPETAEIYRNEKDKRVARFDDSLGYSDPKNSDAAIKNRLLDMYMAVLADDISFAEAKLPLDTATDYLTGVVLADIEKGVRADKKKSRPLNYISPSYQSQKKYEYTTGKSGVGPSALNNAHHVLAQMYGLKLNSSKYPILKYLNLSGCDGVIGKDGIRILDWLNAMISAHVDVAKDTYIIRLNVNPTTYNTLFFLLRSGIGKDTFYYLSQPALKEMANRINVISTKYGNPYGTDLNKLSSQVIKGMISDYIKNARRLANGNKAVLDEILKLSNFANPALFDESAYESFNNIFGKSFMSSKNLMELKNEKDELKYAIGQLKMLIMYSQISPFADALASNVGLAQIDTKKYGISFTSIELFKNKIMEFATSGQGKFFTDPTSIVENSFLGTKLDLMLSAVRTISNGELFRTRPGLLLNDLKGYFFNNGIKKMPSENVVKKHLNAIDSFLRSDFYNEYAKTHNIDIPGMFFGRNSMAKRFMRIKEMIDLDPKLNRLKDNYIINSLSQAIGFDSNSADFINIKAISNSDQSINAKFKAYWSELLESDNEILKKFAEDLILYQYITSGDKSGKNFVKLSEDDRENNKIYEDIDRIMDPNFIFDIESSMSEISKNKWYDKDIVPQVSLTYEDPYSLTGGKLSRIHKNYTISDGSRSNYPAVLIDNVAISYVRNHNKYPVYSKYINLSVDSKSKPTSTVLYELIGLTVIKYSKKDKKPIHAPVYMPIDRKGAMQDGRPILEFGVNKSMIESNNLPKKAEFRGGSLIYDAVINGAPTEVDILKQLSKERGVPYNSTFVSRDEIDMHTPFGYDGSEQTDQNRLAMSDIISDAFSIIEAGGDTIDLDFDFNDLSDAYKIIYKEMLLDVFRDVLSDPIPQIYVTSTSDVLGVQTSSKVPLQAYIDSLYTIVNESSENTSKDREYTPENITELGPNEVFVFGSNSEGVHGKGAALMAKNKFGAKQGQAEGLQGKSYAIITKKDWSVEKSSTLDEIGEGLADFFEFANNHPELKFYMTKLGSSLAGYTVEEIKSQIKEINDINGGNYIPDNVILPAGYEVRDELIKLQQSTRSQADMDRINDHFKSIGAVSLTTEDFNKMPQEMWDKLTQCN